VHILWFSIQILIPAESLEIPAKYVMGESSKWTKQGRQTSLKTKLQGK
jgi:hypothetical protein